MSLMIPTLFNSVLSQTITTNMSKIEYHEYRGIVPTVNGTWTDNDIYKATEKCLFYLNIPGSSYQSGRTGSNTYTYPHIKMTSPKLICRYHTTVDKSGSNTYGAFGYGYVNYKQTGGTSISSEIFSSSDLDVDEVYAIMFPGDKIQESTYYNYNYGGQCYIQRLSYYIIPLE